MSLTGTHSTYVRSPNLEPKDRMRRSARIQSDFYQGSKGGIIELSGLNLKFLSLCTSQLTDMIGYSYLSLRTSLVCEKSSMTVASLFFLILIPFNFFSVSIRILKNLSSSSIFSCIQKQLSELESRRQRLH